MACSYTLRLQNNAYLAGVEAEVLPPAIALLMARTASHVPPSIKAFIEVTAKHTTGYMTHPAVMDAALHLAAGISGPDQPIVLRVPVSVASLTAQSLHPGRVHPTASQTSSSGDTVTCSIKLCTDLNPCGSQASGLVAKEMQSTKTEQAGEAVADFLYETEMQACQPKTCQAFSDRPMVAALGARQKKKASLVYGQLTEQDTKFSVPSRSRMIVDVADSRDSCKAATR